jgi:uncharacterized membrane protein YqjE
MEPSVIPPEQRVEGETTGQLFAHLVDQSRALVKKELELARVELRADIKRELAMAQSMGVACLCALAAFGLLLSAAVFGIGTALPLWAAALIVGGVMLAAGALAALIGWKLRVQHPLDHTQRSLKEDIQWTRERMD